MRKLLIVDDEAAIVKTISGYFADRGYEVLTAASGEAAFGQLAREPDIILLDVTMSGMDGIAFCRAVREEVACPILFLSARTEEDSKIMGLSVGGDDYITKPFSLAELEARIEAHLRREQRPKTATVRTHFGALWIDYGRREAGVGEERLDLPRKEYEVLELLSRRPGQAFSHEQIYERVWGYDAEGDPNSAVTEHVKRIRGKLRKKGIAGHIETVWGIGYRWK